MSLPPPDLPPPPPPPDPGHRPVPLGESAPATPADWSPYTPPVTPLAEPGQERKDVYEVSGSLWDIVKEAFGYPLRQPAMLMIGTFILLILRVAAYAPLIGLVVVLFGWAYVGAYYLEIIGATLNGKDEAPPWPELSSLWDDVIIPGLQMLFIVLLSTGVQLASVFVNSKHPEAEPLFWLGMPIKWLYFPMATLAVVCTGSMWSAFPHRVIPAFFKCLPGYLLCAAMFAGAEILQQILSALLGMIPFLGWLFSWSVFMYAMVVQARLTGLIYLRYKERMPW